MAANKSDQNKYKNLFILPVSNLVVFPSVIVPLAVEDRSMIEMVDQALIKRKDLGAFTQTANGESPPVHQIGTSVSILKMYHQPDGSTRLLVQGLERIRLVKFLQEAPQMVADTEPLSMRIKNSENCEALTRTIGALINKMKGKTNLFPDDLLQLLQQLQRGEQFSDYISANLEIALAEKQDLLETTTLDRRLEKILDILNREWKVIEITGQIQNRVNSSVDRTQREFILREQLKAIKQELGEDDEGEDDWEAEIEALRKQIKKSKMPAEVEEIALKEVERLADMPFAAAEYTISRTYIDWLISLPWNNETKDNMDIEIAQKILEEDHYDLSDVKDRILEFLAVRKLKRQSKGPILCFSGPPGVGKTSLGRSIARAMGRKFVRYSVGGIHDEAEIRGHRRTYIGALPGRIIQMVKAAGTKNPVFMLDEIDKVGSDFRGDPASALLEALDPEQNKNFTDHYLDVPFDLSGVMFITTANVLYNIPPALLDRLEVIEIPGYITEEKIQIAKKYLVPRQLDENGLKKRSLKFDDAAIEKIIIDYTNEAGVRNLEREIARICRKVARGVAEGRKEAVGAGEKDVPEFLGPPKNFPELAGIEDEVGIATGLAWTPVGGEILFIESTVMKGGKHLNLTGQLGEVMRESAQAALSYIRTHAGKYKIDPEFFKKNDVHIHVPAGAVAKDGPSAGVTIATSLLSLLMGRPVRYDVALTGEITLRGRVLPVGGIKEKVLAARRAGIKIIVLPKRNEKDLLDVPENIREKMKFVFVEKLDEVFDLAIRKAEKTGRQKSAIKKREASRKPAGLRLHPK